MEDVSPESLEQMKLSYYQSNVAVSNDHAGEIERQTRDQADSNLWIAERRKRITASRAGGIAKMRDTAKRSSKVKDLLLGGIRQQGMGLIWKISKY